MYLAVDSAAASRPVSRRPLTRAASRRSIRPASEAGIVEAGAVVFAMACSLGRVVCEGVRIACACLSAAAAGLG